jgi:CheY-like chemotaxis protein
MARRNAAVPKILVVDDDADVRKVLQLFLERAGYDVEAVADGTLAVEAYTSSPFDLVITDIVMPEKEGIETISELRELNPGLPIVAISGGGRIGAHDYLTWVRRCGVEHTFCKPIDRKSLLAAVEELVGAGVN